MESEQTCCTAPLWEQRYCLGPYDEPLWVALVRCRDSGGQTGLTTRFYTSERFKKAPELLCDPDTTLYKLPENTVSLLTVSQVHPTEYIVSIKQLPPAGVKEGDPFPPASTCTGFCPPFELECPPREHPECVDGELTCVGKKKEVDTEGHSNCAE